MRITSTSFGICWDFRPRPPLGSTIRICLLLFNGCIGVDYNCKSTKSDSSGFHSARHSGPPFFSISSALTNCLPGGSESAWTGIDLELNRSIDGGAPNGRKCKKKTDPVRKTKRWKRQRMPGVDVHFLFFSQLSVCLPVRKV